MIRVTAGCLKNRKIPLFDDQIFNDQNFKLKDALITIRPSTSKIKEAIFSILKSKHIKLDQLNILDMFCGSGSLGIEGLSRGAKFVSFLDIHMGQLELLRKFLDQAGCLTKMQIMCQDATNPIHSNRLYNIVFIDAPYYQGLVNSTLNNLRQSKVLAHACMLVVETAFDELVSYPICYTKVDERRYSKNKLTFLEYE